MELIVLFIVGYLAVTFIITFGGCIVKLFVYILMGTVVLYLIPMMLYAILHELNSIP